MEPVNPSKKDSKKKYEDYELDNHVRTIRDAGKIMADGHLKKAVLKHAKKKKAELHHASKLIEGSDEEEASESSADERKEMGSIDELREHKKKLKKKMSGY